MLTQGTTPDPKYKLNTSSSSFLTLPYPLDWLICAKDVMIIVLLLHVTGEDEGGMVKLGLVHLY